MYNLKEKVSQKLSRLFADSPTTSSSSSPPSTEPDLHPQDSKEESSSLSSYFSFAIPYPAFIGSKSANHEHHHDYKPIRLDPLASTNDNNDFLEEPLDSFVECKSTEASSTSQKEDGEQNNSDSEVYEEARDQHGWKKPPPNLPDDSILISAELFKFFTSCLPNIVRGCKWVLMYSTLKHGISLRTLIRKSNDLTGPCLLIVADRKGAVFGGLLECPLKPTAKRKYQGTNQAFVFTTLYGEPRLFRPTGKNQPSYFLAIDVSCILYPSSTIMIGRYGELADFSHIMTYIGANRYYYLCLNDMLALGGGGNFALCLDGDLLRGSSGPCETFGSSSLAHDSEFELNNVELWGFTHSSPYLTA